VASYNKFNTFVADIANKFHNLGADTLKVGLTNSAPSATNTFYSSDITEISSGNGYTAGGNTPSITSSSQSSGTYKLILADTTFTASGGSIGPFRYVVLYNDTATTHDLIGWWDYGSALTLNDGDTFTVDFDGTNGVLQIA
jgi:hypothetical protein